MDRNASTYFLQQPTGAELTRLGEQARLLREYVPLLPPYLDQNSIQKILDIGCGPGTWVLDAAFTLPDARLIGLDSSAPMVTYAEARACSEQRENVSFQVADASERLPFSRETFDLVHLQLASSWVKDAVWLPLLREIQRVLRSGKYLMITESQLPETNSSALKQLNQILLTLMRHMQLGMCKQEDTALGTPCALGSLLHQARFFAVKLEEVEINFSYRMPENRIRCFYNLFALFTQLREQVVCAGLASEAHYNCLLQQFPQEVRREDFFGCSKIYTFTARK